VSLLQRVVGAMHGEAGGDGVSLRRRDAYIEVKSLYQSSVVKASNPNAAPTNTGIVVGKGYAMWIPAIHPQNIDAIEQNTGCLLIKEGDDVDWAGKG
jgi:hypothetical protein